MERIFSIHISSDDFLSKKYKIIGSGTDGIVIKYNNEYFLKIYRSKLNFMLNPDILSKETKQYERSLNQGKRNNDPIIYYKHSIFPNEDVRLYSLEALRRAIKKQDSVFRTKLPVGALYIDNQFCGSVIKASKGIQIHKLTGIPLPFRKRIIIDVLEALRELLDNYIYHVDLSNSPHAKSIYIDSNNIPRSFGHSHILINPFTLHPNIIDLDGKSTIYMERYNEKYCRDSLNGMLVLLMEFLLQIDLSELDVQDIDIDFLEEALSNSHITNDIIEKVKDESVTIDDMVTLTKSLH